jgi:hypothetical protein
MIETKVDPVKQEEQPQPESAAARSAMNEGRIDANAFEIINRLHRLSNIQFFMPMLKYRLAATVMICNKLGILGGQAGSENPSPILEKTNEKRYRKSEDPKGAPTVNLSYDLAALQTEAQVTQAPPQYGDSVLFTGFKNYSYDDAPITNSRSYYKNLTGPPTAPRYENSHVITNYVVYGSDESNGFSLECGWEGIRSEKNPDFFEEDLIAPENLRNLRGATQYDVDQIDRQVLAWGNHMATGKYDV